jgi:predicted acylesterase/phospholipase RssA/CRP-like cAMP-binding protein
MMENGHSTAAHDHRVLKILKAYFGIRMDHGHPLLDKVQSVQLAGGEWLMHQGDTGDSLYFLVRGRLQAWAADAEGNARARFLNEIVPGDSVGELSLLTGAPRAVGIQAIRDSLLLAIDRPTFEQLSHQFPALALKLASNVATLLQSQNAPQRPSTRNLKTICILPLESTHRTDRFCEKLAREIDSQDQSLIISSDRLAMLGAPVTEWRSDGSDTLALAHWLHEKEDIHRFLLYLCDPENPSWTEFAMRQSDMILYVGDTGTEPGTRSWELRAQERHGAAIARRLLVLLQGPSDQAISGTAEWLEGRDFDFHVHVHEDRPADIGRVARIVSGNALGLVLAGGAARGFAHLGVYRAMQELGLPVDWIGGTSIGGIMGAALASPRPLDEAVELVRECFVVGKPFSDYTLPLVSLISGRRMDRLLKQYLDLNIEDLPTPFFCVSCHLDSGSMTVHERGNLADAVRAGASIPGIIPPAVVDRRLAVDGSVINNLPVDIMQKKPVGTIVGVDLSSDKQYEVSFDKTPSAWAILRGRYLPFSRRYRVPALSTILLKATELGTLARVRELGRQADLLLKPPVRHFGMTEVKSFDKIVQAGYEHAMTELTAWLESGGYQQETHWP